MQEQIDLMILEQVSNGHFCLSVKFSTHSRDIEREYKSRGFTVRSNNENTVISWDRPHLDPTQRPNKKIFSYFTAQQLYYVLTVGKDLRSWTNAVVYENLIREKTIVDTHGMEKTTVYNLFANAITKAQDDGFIVTITDEGVITSNRNMDFNVDDIREVDVDIVDGYENDLLSIISNDSNNILELGTDNKLYVENSLKSENW